MPGNPSLDNQEREQHRDTTFIPVASNSVQLVFQGHVRLRLEANARAEDVGQGAALLGQRVDDGRAGGRQRGLEHVAENAEDAVEALVVVIALTLPLDARHHLRDDHEVDDEGRGEQGILADVEDAGGG